MAGKIKGITIKIGGDTKPLEKALSHVNKTSHSLQSELREVEKLLKLDPGNTELPKNATASEPNLQHHRETQTFRRCSGAG
jgi:phage-related minor tail protein